MARKIKIIVVVLLILIAIEIVVAVFSIKDVLKSATSGSEVFLEIIILLVVSIGIDVFVARAIYKAIPDEVADFTDDNHRKAFEEGQICRNCIYYIPDSQSRDYMGHCRHWSNTDYYKNDAEVYTEFRVNSTSTCKDFRKKSDANDSGFKR